MGATLLTTEVRAKDRDSFNRAWNRIVRACEIEYGTDPYNGTWSTIAYIKTVSDPIPNKKWTEKKKKEVVDMLADEIDSREAVRIKMTAKKYFVIGWVKM